MRVLHFTGNVGDILREFGRLEMIGESDNYEEGEWINVCSTSEGKHYKLRSTKSRDNIVRLLSPFKYLTRNFTL